MATSAQRLLLLTSMSHQISFGTHQEPAKKNNVNTNHIHSLSKQEATCINQMYVGFSQYLIEKRKSTSNRITVVHESHGAQAVSVVRMHYFVYSSNTSSSIINLKTKTGIRDCKRQRIRTRTFVFNRLALRRKGSASDSTTEEANEL